MLSRFDIVLAQETHGVETDWNFRPSSHQYYSTHYEPNLATGASASGGCVIAINRAEYLHENAEIQRTVIQRGRCIAVHILDNRRNLLIINLHLQPNLTTTQKKNLFNDIKNFIDNHNHATVIFGGDFNFIHNDDRRYDPTSGSELIESNDIATHFESTFTEYTELFQPNFTRAQAKNPNTGTFSRIDRFYTNIPAPHLTTLSINVDTIGNILSLNRPSDHIPVFAKILKEKPRYSNNIPHHIASHENYGKNLSKYHYDIDP